MNRFTVTGMSCAACQARVEKAVSGVPGVESCAVSLLTNSMNVEGSASSEAIITAVKAAGYGCEEQTAQREAKQDEDKETKIILIRLIVSAVLTIACMAFMHFGIKWPQIAIALAVMVINRRFFISGFKGVIHKSPNMDTLVALGSLSAFAYGYYDSAAMILTLITVGKMLESKAKGRTTNALKALMRIVPQSSIKVGDEFTVRAGDKIPADAVILSGTGFVDESMLTGESMPAEKAPGGTISAGTVCLKGSMNCKAEAVGEETVLSQIIRLVSDAASTKAPIARLADKVSAVFVPVVIAIAVITTIIWLIIGKDAGFAVSRGISVLVISCPCSLGLATPVAIMVASGKGARNGILFKTAAAIEETGRIDTVILDKTGTLTLGSDSIRDLESLENSTEQMRLQANTLRPESLQAVSELKTLGLEVWMISGDREERAKATAASCGIDNVLWEVKPEDKINAVSMLQEKGRKVLMVGDGINDGPALTKADVGAAIGNGTDVAIDAANVVLMKSSLLDVPAAVRLGRKTLKNIHENLFWAFFYNSIGIPVAAGVLSGIGITLTPAISAVCMSLSSFCVVMNALRLNLFNIYGDNKTADISQMESEIKEKETEKMTKEFKVEGMMCPHCEARVKKALESVPGVISANADHVKGIAMVECETSVTDEMIIGTIEKEDYKVIR